MAYGRHLSGIKLGKGRDGRSLRVRRCRSGVKRHRVRDEARSGWAEQDSGMRWSTLMRGSKDALKKGGVAPEGIVEDEGDRPPLPRSLEPGARDASTLAAEFGRKKRRGLKPPRKDEQTRRHLGPSA